ncbi:AMP-binding protein [Bradyrhizobium australiense]|uniref:AMP-binding protein n=1 Tax=Bradyrhizobium australiense TaxID=2721161 RepID=UPI001AEECC94|nr:AMP-binding protein [Bradyrhizobium australiense]
MIGRKAQADDDDRATWLKQTLNWGWSPDSIRQFRRRFRVRTQDAYGMTEIGFGTLMTNQFDDLAESGSVGIRAPFRKLRLMNEDGSPTPVGDVGELWVSGRGILTGYWNKPNANAALFEGDWFKDGEGGKIVATDSSTFARAEGGLGGPSAGMSEPHEVPTTSAGQVNLHANADQTGTDLLSTWRSKSAAQRSGIRRHAGFRLPILNACARRGSASYEQIFTFFLGR